MSTKKERRKGGEGRKRKEKREGGREREKERRRGTERERKEVNNLPPEDMGKP
jgi:hypothetical protein